MNSRKIKFKDKEFNSFKDCCRYYGVSDSLVRYYMNLGNSLVESVDIVLEKKKGILINGKNFKNIRDCCRYYGLDYQYVINLKGLGYNLSEAVEKGILKKNKEPRGYKKYNVKINGKEFKDLKTCCKYYGLSYKYVINSVKKEEPEVLIKRLIDKKKKKSNDML